MTGGLLKFQTEAVFAAEYRTLPQEREAVRNSLSSLSVNQSSSNCEQKNAPDD